MNRFFKILLAPIVSLSLVSCGPLPEYNVSTADADFRSDMSEGRLTALAVCGFACETPGFPNRALAYCFSDSVATRTIDPTGDVIESDRHLELKEKARDYAEAYNSLLLKHVRDAGLGRCPNEENWDSAWNDLLSLVNWPNIVRANVFAPLTLDESFRVVAEPSDNWSSLPSRICRVFLANGIGREVLVEVASTDRNAESESAFRCVDGAVTDRD